MTTRHLTIRHARWAPVTAGEYHRATGEVVVNLVVVEAVVRTTGHAAALVESAIVAHERAHAAASASWTRAEEEAVARAAAVAAAGEDVVVAIEGVLGTACEPARGVYAARPPEPAC